MQFNAYTTCDGFVQVLLVVLWFASFFLDRASRISIARCDRGVDNEEDFGCLC